MLMLLGNLKKTLHKDLDFFTFLKENQRLGVYNLSILAEDSAF